MAYDPEKYVARFANYDHPWPLPEGPDVVVLVAGKLTRGGAMLEARALYGDLGTVADHGYLKSIWCIGRYDLTVGRGRTWERALANAIQKKKKLDARAQAEMFRAQAELTLEVSSGTQPS